MSIEAQLEQGAHDLGFVACGFAEATETTGTAVFHDWLEAGRHAGMTFLERHAELRKHPSHITPAVKTVIGVAARYPANERPGAGFSTYARGRDYHDVVRSKLRELATWLRAHASPDALARICVDSAPLAEREWALRCGLGWQGKQGQIIHPEHGACLLLGFVLTDVALQPSLALPEQCGDCRCCIEACPTGAVREDRTIDARRCLSYLSIEHAGDVPARTASCWGETLFGCDYCTAVCPRNGGDIDAQIMQELAPNGAMPSADELLDMDSDQFKQRFARTAVSRSGLDRLQRNARLAKRL